MRHRATRFTPLLVVVALVAAACTSKANEPQAAPSASASAVARCPFPGASPSVGTSPSASPPSSTAASPNASTAAGPPSNGGVEPYTPINQAAIGIAPPSGLYHKSNGDEVKIPHTTVVCGQPFTEHLDFSRLGPWPACVDGSSDPNLARPCHEVFRTGPDNRATLLRDTWQPVEGDALHVVCQAVSNRDISQGAKQDNGPPPIQISNVWNKVADARIQPAGFGFISDLWMGNAGFRGPLCPPSDNYVPGM